MYTRCVDIWLIDRHVLSIHHFNFFNPIALMPPSPYAGDSAETEEPKGGDNTANLPAPKVQTGSAADNTAVNTLVNIKPAGTPLPPQQQQLVNMAAAAKAAHGGKDLSQAGSKQQPVMKQAFKKSPAEERMGRQIAHEREIAQLQAKTRAADPFAYDMGRSPGVQAALGIASPGIALLQGTAQVAHGVQTGSTTEIVLGAANVATGAIGLRANLAKAETGVNNTLNTAIKNVDGNMQVSLSLDDAAKVNPSYAQSTANTGGRVFTQTAEDGDLLFYSTKIGDDIIEFGGNFSKSEGTLTIENFDIDGGLTNQLGIRGIKDILTDFGKQQGVNQIIIQGAKRTTGANPGKVPSQLIFKIN